MKKPSIDAFATKGEVAALSLFALLACLAYVAVRLQSAPNAVAASAASSDFSSGRAMDHIRAIGSKAHPLGSPEHDVVRDYIISELGSLGVDSRIHETTAISEGGDTLVAATVQNIIGVIKGADNSRSILLVAHYDSVPTSPGASDNASGVAVILETLRAIKSGAPLRNDIIALFSDGEEAGLLGAQAFKEEQLRANEVGLVMNFDARGNRGPSLMFETSYQNGWVIQEIARMPLKPLASSLMSDVYKRLLRNDTDLTVFKNAGLTALNFAHIDGENSYHSSLDTPDRIDENTVQSEGQNSLSLTRHFGNLDLSNTKQANAVYFNVLGRSFLYYRQGWVLPLCALLLLLFIGVVLYGFKSKQVTALGIALGFITLLLSAVSSVAVVRLILWIAMAGQKAGGPFQLYYERNLCNIGSAALMIGITYALYALFRKKASVASMMVGAMLWWLLLTLVISFQLPGASYLFAWPLLFGLIGFFFMFVLANKLPAVTRVAALLLLSVIPAVMLVVPIAHMVLIGVGLMLSWMVMAVISLLLGLLIPQIEAISSLFGRTKGWSVITASAIVAVACIIAVLVNNRHDKDEPLPNNVFYVLNATENKAVWASIDQVPDEYTSQFLSAHPERGRLNDYLPLSFGQYLKTQAQAVSIEPPSVELVKDSKENGFRTVEMHILSPRQAPAISITLDPSVKVLEASINGKPIQSKNARPGARAWQLNYTNIPKGGIYLALKMSEPCALNVSVVDQSYELPQELVLSSKPRPDYMIPAQFPLSDSTLVNKKFSF